MQKTKLKIGDKLFYIPRNKTYTITKIDREYNIVAMGVHHRSYKTIQDDYQYIDSNGKLVDLTNN